MNKPLKCRRTGGRVRYLTAMLPQILPTFKTAPVSYAGEETGA